MKVSRRRLVSGVAALPFTPAMVATGQTGTPYETKEYDFKMLAPEDLPLNTPRLRPLESSGLDENGVLRYRNGSEQTHAVAQAQWIFRALVNHTYYDDDGALESAIANGHALLEAAVQTEDALYFPYSEPFAVHGNEDDTLDAPWFSGMGQGQVLTAFIRLFDATGDQFWRDAADRTFASFVPINDESRPWSTTVGRYQTLWFEEFPVDPPCTAFNGHVFAAFGVYEYWMHTGNQQALDLLRGAFYTIEKLGETYRNPGGVSSYCLEHRAVSAGYHDVHVVQLHDDFYEDAPASQFITGTITLPAGPLETYEVWSTGSFKERRFVDIPEATEVPVNERFKVSGEGTFAYRVSGGEYEGLVVREQIDRIVVDGIVLGGQNENGPIWGTVRQYDPPRRAYFFSHPNYAYPNDNGQIGPRIPRAEFYMEGSVQVLAAGIENGRQLTLVSTEEFGEVWISGTPRYLDRDDVFDW